MVSISSSGNRMVCKINGLCWLPDKAIQRLNHTDKVIIARYDIQFYS